MHYQVAMLTHHRSTSNTASQA